MSIIVQKFGGTSVADSEKILAAARMAIRAQKEGNQVVTVVSAMGGNTDMLVELAQQVHEEPPAREMDMLLSTGEQITVALMSMAIHSLGHQAVGMTGSQLGIKTDSSHTKARIQSITTDRIHEALDAGKIVIAAGFQGIDELANITTLGRGGSDTTAVALAAALGADRCEIHTDVDGVYTTDPRIVPDARRVTRISYDEMLELASAGSGVMHNRSIEFAKKFDVPVHVRSSFSDRPGTMIVAEPESVGQAVCGAAMVKNEARVTVLGVPDRPGAAMTVFSKIAEKRIAMDMIVQNIGDHGQADISFTVLRDELPRTLKVVGQAVKELGAEGFDNDDEVSKISVVGLGMENQSGVAELMFRTLAEHGVNILLITTSEIKLSVLVERSHATEALRAIHKAFRLDEEPAEASISSTQTAAEHAQPGAETTDAVVRLQGMEDLIIDGIHLDESQACVTLLSVPDTPGLAAQVFDEVAEGGIVVDMIVQSIGREGHASLSFTVPRDNLAKAQQVATALAKGFNGPPPRSVAKVAKLSISGVGMRSHTTVAARAFRCLSAAGINVEMINTSEVRLNLLVDGERGSEAVSTLRAEFDDVIA